MLHTRIPFQIFYKRNFVQGTSKHWNKSIKKPVGERHERLVMISVVVSAGGELAINAFQNLAGSEDSD
jgi:hypothetical protein